MQISFSVWLRIAVGVASAALLVLRFLYRRDMKRRGLSVGEDD